MKKSSFFKIHILGALLAAVLGQSIRAAAPLEIAYQGKLTDSSGVPIANGPATLTFRIYDRDTLGNSLTDDIVNNVTVINGVFSTTILFTDGNPFTGSSTGDYYLDVKYNNSSFNARQKLVAAPFALGVAGGSVGMGEIANSIKGQNGGLAVLDVNGHLALQADKNLVLSGSTARIRGLALPLLDTDAASKLYVDDATTTLRGAMAGSFVSLNSAGNIQLNANKSLLVSGTGTVRGLRSDPVNNDEAASKAYVDIATNNVTAAAAGTWTMTGTTVTLANPNSSLTLGDGAHVSGTKLTVHGNVELLDNLVVRDHLTVGGGQAITRVMSKTQTLDFGDIPARSAVSRNITGVTGAVAGSVVFLGPPSNLDSALMATAVVTAADTVRVTVFNSSGTVVNNVDGSFRATVFNH